LAKWGTSEFSPPDDESVLKHIPILEILNQGTSGGISGEALLFQLCKKIAVLVPTGMHQLNEAGPSFKEAAGGQAVTGKGSPLLHIRTVSFDDIIRFLFEIEQFGHARLHPECHFILRDPGLNFRVSKFGVMGLVELGNPVEKGAACFSGNTCWIIKIGHRSPRATEFDSLEIYLGRNPLPQ
jgi:hypothetical protein